MSAADPATRVWVDGFPIDCDPPATVLAAMSRAISRRSAGHTIAITNPESIYHARRLPGHAAFLRAADFSLCDGVGVMLAAGVAGRRVRRYNGPVLQLDASRHGVALGWRHFYIGGTGGSAAEMVRRLTARFPGIEVCGVYEPPFRPLTATERAALIADIRVARADIVWVGLGLIKQEALIADLVGEVAVPWMIGVGAAFDYHSGRVPWAPALVRRAGLEWLFRLIVQPRLRARRYWWSALWVVGASLRGLVRRVRPDCGRAG